MALEDALVAIFPPNGKVPVGAGLLVEKDLVLTCAHVVNSAIGRNIGEVGRPEGEVWIKFHESWLHPIKASVDKEKDAWSGPSALRQTGADLCLLRLASSAPDKIEPAKLRIFEDLTLRDFRAVGFPQEWEGSLDIALGRIVAREHSLYLLRPEPGAAASYAAMRSNSFLGGERRPAGVIHSGFSGGPVEVQGKIVGLVTEARARVSDATAYMIPVSAFPERIARRAEIPPDDPLTAYRNLVAREYQYADYRGIFGTAQAKHAASLPLDDVYVVPTLIPEHQSETAHEKEQSLINTLLDAELASEERVRLEEKLAALTGRRWRPQGGPEQTGLSLGGVLAKERRAVILGGPGVGKSTLIRYLARTCALGPEATTQRLNNALLVTPVVISLASFADARAKQVGLTLHGFMEQQVFARGGAGLWAAITSEIASRRLFVFLDGVDEAPDTRARVEIVQAVEQFMAGITGNRILITSRPYGYIRISGRVDHFYLSSFSPQNIWGFVHRWEREFERLQHPDATDLERADREAKAIVSELDRNPKVRDLATNPLMLVMICLIRTERSRMPEQRVELYHRVLQTLMETWNDWRSLPHVDMGGAQLPIDRLIQVWGAVAHWTRRTKPSGIIHRVALKKKLVEILKEKEFDEEDAEATAESYLKAATEQAGLLEERGKDVFAFWHSIFEEYLAALDLITPPSSAVERLLRLRGDPGWREVILLAVGHVGLIQHDQDTASAIVEAIADHDPGPLDEVSHSHLRLAAACIADSARVRRSLKERLIIRLTEAILAQSFELLEEVFVQTARALSSLHPLPATVSSLTSLRKHHNPAIRAAVVQLIGNVAAENLEAHALCKQMLEEDGDGYVRSCAALGLARAGEYSPRIWEVLGGGVPGGAPGIMSHVREFLVRAPRHAVASLLTCRTCPSYQRYALLSELVRTNDDARVEIAARLETEDFNIRFEAAELLWGAGRREQKVIDTIVSCLNDEALRIRATESLYSKGRLDYSLLDNSFIASLVRDLVQMWPKKPGGQPGGPWEERLLVDMGKHDERVVLAVSAYLDSSEIHVRFESGRLLYEISGANSGVAAALESCLNSDDRWLGIRAARLLHSVKGKEKQVEEALISDLAAEDLYVRRNAAQLLKEMGRSDKKVIDALVSCLAHSLLPGVPNQIGILLLEIGQEHEEAVFEALKSHLDSPDPELRLEVVRVLHKMGRLDRELTRQVFSWLSEGKSRFRIRTAGMLLDIDIESDELSQALSLWLSASDVHLRLEAVRLLHEMGRVDLRVLVGLISCFTDASLPRHSLPDYEVDSLILKIGRSNEKLVELLTECLASNKSEVTMDAARLLIQLGRTDDKLVNALLYIVRKEDVHWSLQAAQMLFQIGRKEEITDVLVSWLGSDSFQIRLASASLLVAIKRIEPAVKALARLVHPTPAAIVATCSRLEDPQSLTEADNAILTELVHSQSPDSEETRLARRWFLEWIWVTIEPDQAYRWLRVFSIPAVPIYTEPLG